VREGENILHIAVKAKQDTMATVGQAIQLYKEWDVDRMFVDVIGVGAGVYDRLFEQKYPVTPVNVANKAPWQKDAKPEDGQPKLMRDHVWMQCAKWFQEQSPSFALADKDMADDLALELSSVKYKFDSAGKIVVESKQEMKARGLRSPDLADALCLTFAPEKSTSRVIAPYVMRVPIVSPM